MSVWIDNLTIRILHLKCVYLIEGGYMLKLTQANLVTLKNKIDFCVKIISVKVKKYPEYEKVI